MTDTYGWDLLAESSVRGGRPLSHTDVLTLVVHWTLTRNGYRCQGLDTNGTDFDGNAAGSESLPQGWQDANADTAIRYTGDGKRYLLMVSSVDSDVIFNLLRLFDHEVRCVKFNVAETVRATSGALGEMVPGYKCVVKSVQAAFTVRPGRVSASSTQTQDSSRTREPYHTTPEPTPGLGVPLGGRTPLAVGRADLDPLAGLGPMPGGGLGGIVGGGNVFDPFGRMQPGQPGLPPGAVPPGARFDPIGPNVPGRPTFGPAPGSGRAPNYYGEPDNDDLGPGF